MACAAFGMCGVGVCGCVWLRVFAQKLPKVAKGSIKQYGVLKPPKKPGAARCKVGGIALPQHRRTGTRVVCVGCAWLRVLAQK